MKVNRYLKTIGLVCLGQAGLLLNLYAAGQLTVQIITSPNLVVDSNVLSPSSNGPELATIEVKYSNSGDADLTDVWAYIGNFSANTPGLYPARSTSDSGFATAHPQLAAGIGGAGSYSFTHHGGAAGSGDAQRFLGTLHAGETRVVYWHIEYPHKSINGTQPVWGVSNDQTDDLWLNLDAWGTGQTGAGSSAANATKKLTLRNMISAMANKVYPNGGAWIVSTPVGGARPGNPGHAPWSGSEAWGR